LYFLLRKLELDKLSISGLEVKKEAFEGHIKAVKNLLVLGFAASVFVIIYIIKHDQIPFFGESLEASIGLMIAAFLFQIRLKRIYFQILDEYNSRTRRN
jgi:hypothetical protein